MRKMTKRMYQDCPEWTRWHLQTGAWSQWVQPLWDPTEGYTCQDCPRQGNLSSPHVIYFVVERHLRFRIDAELIHVVTTSIFLPLQPGSKPKNDDSSSEVLGSGGLYKNKRTQTVDRTRPALRELFANWSRFGEPHSTGRHITLTQSDQVGSADHRLTFARIFYLQ